jgi:uroporphyrinogen-III decarboxylase
MSRLKGAAVDRPPNFNILMTFAARHIGRPLSEYYLDYRVLVDANLAMVEDFESGIVQAISDPYRETHDFGAEIEFPEDGLPLCKSPLLQDPDKLRTLCMPDPASGRRMSDRVNAVRLMREKVGDEVPVMGWVEGALSEAADLRGDSNILMDLYDRPEWVEELLEICTETAIDFARAQVEAGAHIVGLGDAIGSQVSPDL